LQVFHSEGWWEVPLVNNSFVVSAGDLIEHWTGGRIKAAVHRIVSPVPAPDRPARLLIEYFSQPNPDAAVAPIAGISAGQGAPAEARDLAAAR
jgi:isopenicillin N synthase-like dioxygenase